MNNHELQRVDQKALEQFRDLFKGRDDWYGHRDFQTNAQWTEGKRGPDGKLVKDARGNNIPPDPLTDEHFHRHFNKVLGLGIIPIQLSGNVNFGVLDIDKDDIDHVELVNRIKNLGLPLYVFVSRSGAAHAVFFIGGAGKPAKLVAKRLEVWALALGCGGHYPTAEIFPKQKDLEETGAVGNYINLPFFNTFSDPTDKHGKYVTPSGEFVGLYEFLASVTVWNPGDPMPLPIRSVSFEQGPPCLETLQVQGMPPGTRNLGLYNVGVYYKKADPENWKDLLYGYNQKYLSEPLSPKEMETIIKSLGRKDYQYKCKEDPIASVCESGLCKTRLYGIKTAEERLKDKAARVELPIEGLIKYSTDPVTWGLKVNKVIVNVTSTELLCYANLRKYLLETLTIVPPNIKPDVWEIKLKDLVENAEHVQVSEDAGELQHMKDLIDEFVRNGSSNERMLDAHSTYLKWEEDRQGSEAHMTTKVIREHLIGMKLSNLPVARLTLLLKQSGWESQVKRFNGVTKRVWVKFYPEVKPKFSDEMTGDIVDEDLIRSVTGNIFEKRRDDPD